MPHDFPPSRAPSHDSLSVALQLLDTLGERAVTASKVRVVEMIAADDLPGAIFWRAVLRHCEQRRPARLDGPPPEADGALAG